MPGDLDLARRSHALLMEAMELDPPARRGFVDERCAGDAVLRKRLHELLDAADRAGTFLDRPALAGPDESARIPDAVGDYLVVGVLGSGGMATVYEAIQEQPRRRVALKVLNASMSRTEAYQRFRLETEALARLLHPGIAQIYESGAAHLGHGAPSPFFAMELVPGAETITEYARRHGLGLRRRLEMLASVCDAVHHGHQHGIIHRDLKPGNVLVDDQGRAKVIDFGVARQAGTGGESITREGDAARIVGTLNWMSPEQCGGGQDVDVRTDVYALGVMLYELACDRLPHHLDGLPLGAALRRVMEDDPEPPDVGGAARARDLRAIILKAIDKSPKRRYDSASALASDVRRYLGNQPIEARATGVSDHCRLFARRNPGVVLALGVLASCVAIVAMVSTLFAVRLASEVKSRRTAEARALRERDEARWGQYAADISGALSALQAGEFQQMRSHLSGVGFAPRGWEWGYLSRAAERSTRVIRAHDDMILDMAVDAGSMHVATGGSEGLIRVWEPRHSTLAGEARLPGGARIASLVFLEDGRLVSADSEGVVRVHPRIGQRRDAGPGDADTVVLRSGGPPSDLMQGVRTLATTGSPARSVAVLPGGRLAIPGSGGGVWNVNEPDAPPTPFPGEQGGGVQGVVASADGSLLATFNDRGVICVRDAGDLSIRQTFAFPSVVTQVRFSPDGARLAAVGQSPLLMVWDTRDGSVVRAIDVTGGVNTARSLAFSPDGMVVAAGLVHRGIVAFSIESGARVGGLEGHAEAVSGIWFHPSGGWLLTSSWDGTIRTWEAGEVRTPRGGATLEGHGDHVLSVAFTPDGSMLASVSFDRTLRLWDAEVQEPIAALSPTGQSLMALAIAPDGRTIAVGGSGDALGLVDLRDGSVRRIEGLGSGVASLAFDPTAKRLAVGFQDGRIRILPVDDPGRYADVAAHEARVLSVAFSPDGRFLASGSRDRTVRVWDATTGAQRACLQGHTLDVFAVLFSPDSTRLYSGSRDQSVRVWDVATGLAVRVLEGHGQYVTSLALSPDGQRLAAGSWFGQIVLFDVDRLDLIASFRAHDTAIRGLAFSPDGRWLATAAYGGHIRLMDSWSRAEGDKARATARQAQARARAALDATPTGNLGGATNPAGSDPAGLSDDAWLLKERLRRVYPVGTGMPVDRPV